MANRALRLAWLSLVVASVVEGQQPLSSPVGIATRAEIEIPTAWSAKKKTKFRSLIGTLVTGDPAQRCQAIHELADSPYREFALGELRRVLVHDNQELVRRTAANVFYGVEYTYDVVALPDLVAAMRDSSPAVRLRAAIAVGQCVYYISDRVWYKGKEKDTERLAYLKYIKSELSHDPDPVIRGLMQFGWSVQFTKEPRGRDIKNVVPLVVAAIKLEKKLPIPFPSDDQVVNYYELDLFELFGVIGPAAESAVPMLIKELEGLNQFPTGHQGDANTDLCQSILGSLVGIGEPAVPHLLKGLTSPREAVRKTAALAMAFIDPKSSEPVPVLLKSLEGPCWGKWQWQDVILRADVDALANIGTAVVPTLLDHLKRNPAIEENVRRVLLDQPPSTVPVLIAALQDRDASIRSMAAIGLGYRRKGARAAIRHLEELLQDESNEVRQAAREAITQINEPLKLEGTTRN